MRAFLEAIAQPWAMTEEMLRQLLEIAARENLPADIEALRREMGRPLEGARGEAYTRDGVAVIPVTGPIFPRANLMTELSGATSTQMLAMDIQRAVTDSAVNAIVLHFDSPGGAVAGINELAAQIREATETKRVIAYVGVMAASAAYWLASAASEIVIDRAATVGSIGVRLVVQKSGDKATARDVTFVSSVSPRKDNDPATESGSRLLQQHADELGEIFVSEILAYRPQMKREDVLSLGGWLAIGAQAVGLKLADRLGSLEGLISELSNKSVGSGAGGFMKFSETKIGQQIAGLLGMEVQGAAAAEIPPIAVTTTTPQPSAEADAIRAQLAEAQKALADERDNRIRAEADGWIQSLAAQHLGTPAARDACKSAYVQAATDDLIAPVPAGRQTRVEQLKAITAFTLGLTDVLTLEMAPGVGAALAPDPAADADDLGKDGTVLYARAFAKQQAARRKAS